MHFLRIVFFILDSYCQNFGKWMMDSLTTARCFNMKANSVPKNAPVNSNQTNSNATRSSKSTFVESLNTDKYGLLKAKPARIPKSERDQDRDKFNDEKAQKSVVLTENEAEKRTTMINKSAHHNRKYILDMYYGGCRALGHLSFFEYVKNEIKLDHSTVYRQKDAAIVELRLGYKIGTVPESILRDLIKVPTETLKLVWAEAMEKKPPTDEFPSGKLMTEVLRGWGLKDKPKPLKSEALVKKISGLTALIRNQDEWTAVIDVVKKDYRKFKSLQ